MEDALQQTHQTVTSLRALLESPHDAITVEYRSTDATWALAIVEPLAMDDVECWWSDAFEQLHTLLASTGAARSGPDGALYSSGFFEDEVGEVVAFIPVTVEPESSLRARALQIPAAELAITLHRGAFSELDQTYGALGTFVAEREIGVQGPIREHYLVTDTDDESLHRTEVCWPVFHTKGDET